LIALEHSRMCDDQAPANPSFAAMATKLSASMLAVRLA
jgi:hypothetical protein